MAPLTVETVAMRTLQAYAWPGNVRELRNFCENVVVTRRGGSLTEFDLDPKYRGSGSLHVRCFGDRWRGLFGRKRTKSGSFGSPRSSHGVI